MKTRQNLRGNRLGASVYAPLHMDWRGEVGKGDDMIWFSDRRIQRRWGGQMVRRRRRMPRLGSLVVQGGRGHEANNWRPCSWWEARREALTDGWQTGMTWSGLAVEGGELELQDRRQKHCESSVVLHAWGIEKWGARTTANQWRATVVKELGVAVKR
jgi:hypothetical protein